MHDNFLCSDLQVDSALPRRERPERGPAVACWLPILKKNPANDEDE